MCQGSERMEDRPLMIEDHISQIPALQLLIKMGYEYITPEEVFKERREKLSNVMLEGILDKQLRKMNKVSYKGHEYPFSNSNIASAIDAIKNIPFDGLVRDNEKVYDLISLGKSFEETIQGNIKSYTINYIDWDNLDNNVFHLTEEFEVETSDGRRTRRPDIVIFVNGIPFAVIECKRPDIDKPMEEAISQQIRNQKVEEVPRLFIYPQVLMAISKNEAKYGTVSTERKFWAVWKEKEKFEKQLKNLVNIPLDQNTKDKLFSSRFNYVKNYFDEIEKSGRLLTEQDKALYSLCRKERFMELSQKFIVYDAGRKKIARYQQYFAVKNSLARVKKFDSQGQRMGGVIWHTQGSGKSLIMVMLAKAIAIDKEIENPRIVIVTDRINLDDQISDTFKHCGKEPVQAKTGRHLLEVLENNKNTIITSVIDKFTAAISKKKTKVVDTNLFVLVDESHRSQYGVSNAMMMRILPKACYIGFTGTPLMKKEKNTARKFGGFIDTYKINEAVDDKAVVSLLYEGRHVPQEVNKKSIDTWFDRVCAPLSEQQRVDLKKKFSRIEKLNHSDQKVYMIAYDISVHYRSNWQGTGFKGQLATSSKVQALKFKNLLDEIGMVSSEVVMSSPDTREGHDDVFKETDQEVQKFWKSMMSRYGNEKNYNREVKRAFNDEGDPEIVIVVDKLLTGFDSPRNTVLYVSKYMTEHTLLQAIARVNRLFEGKDFGYIIDYMGILGELDSALTTYSALNGFDENDLTGTLANVLDEIKTLPQKHSDLWDVFKEVENKKDEEEYERLLFNEELRDLFYIRLSAYSRILGIALSTTQFYDVTSDTQIKKYKEDLKFFQKLRGSVKKRYAEEIDFKEYESKIQKLLDTYVTSDEVIKITKLVNIFDKEQFENEISRVTGKAARADMIAHRTKRSIEEKFEEDPAFYKRFSELLAQTIEDYQQARIEEAEYFNRVTSIMNSVRDRIDDMTPRILDGRDIAKAFFGIAYDVLSKKSSESDKLREEAAKVGMKLDEIIINNQIVDWQMKENIQNRMKNEIEDYLLDHPELNISYDEVDLILEKVLKIAKIRYAK